MRLTKVKAAELVDQGAKFLSTMLGSDWWKAINVDRLDLSAPTCCIEGQLFGSSNQEQFDRLNTMLGIDETEHGFSLPSEYHKRNGGPTPNWQVLTNAWIEKILALKEAQTKEAA